MPGMHQDTAGRNLVQSMTPYVAALQDTVTGFLLAGVGNVDLRRKTNFLIVTESECDSG